MYRLLIENKAAREVESLHGEILGRLVKTISSLKQNPRPHGVKKLFTEDGWRIREGWDSRYKNSGSGVNLECRAIPFKLGCNVSIKK